MRNTLYCLSVALLLDACGGGAGGPSAPALPTPPVADEAPGALTHPAQEPPAEVAQRGDGTAAAFDLAGYAPPPAADGAPQLAASVVTGDAAPPPQELAAPAVRNLYVATGGSDANPGTASQPFRSLWRAARAAGPGTKVWVAPGTYSGGIRTVADGTASARIAYISTVKWGAKIVPPPDSPNKTARDNRGSFVDIVGFEIDGSAYQGGTRWTHGIYNGGSWDAIRNNHVHHVAQNIGCNSNGGAGIGVDSYYHGANADVIGNLVHDIGPPGCRFVQGIYVSTSGRIKNNVVYRVSEGGICLWHDARNVIISNNTVTGSNTGIIVGGGDFYYATGPNDNTMVYSNIVYDNKMGISEQGKTGLNNIYRNNLVYQNSRYDWRLNNGLTHGGTVSAAPLFVGNARAATPLLKPAPGSPAIGKASEAFAESTDFDGRPRNRQAGFDIGAYQH
jgi:parallel beta-helix repeat protein